jgi:hypothetical protein
MKENDMDGEVCDKRGINETLKKCQKIWTEEY